jgi:hypothetical protein
MLARVARYGVPAGGIVHAVQDVDGAWAYRRDPKRA